MIYTYVTWRRYNGYEVSTKGDKRFSAFNALLRDGRTIEMHYQCDVKQYQPGGYDWRLGKDKPPKRNVDQATLLAEYIDLWRQWAMINPDLINELAERIIDTNGVLSDCFATTEINQAHALAVILNESMSR